MIFKTAQYEVNNYMLMTYLVTICQQSFMNECKILVNIKKHLKINLNAFLKSIQSNDIL